MTDQEVLSYYGKGVSVTRNDGTVVTGFFCVFIPDFDNAPEVPLDGDGQFLLCANAGEVQLAVEQ